MKHSIIPHCNAHAAPLKSPIAPPLHALRASLGASLVLMAELCSAHLLAATVPTEWTVRIGPRSASYQAERRHGDALCLRATLTYNGQPLAYTGPARLYAQTNGMGSAWWDLAPCTVVSNTLQATWLPSFDTGADVVDLFLGGPSNYQAAARIRFLPSPGSVPNSLPLPAPTLDFSTVIITNAPFATFEDLATATNEVLQAAIISDNAKRDKTDLGVYSNTVEFTEWVFTPSMYDGHPISMWTNYSAGAWWAPFADGFNIGLGKGDENSLNLSWTEDSEAQINITATRTQVIRTIPVPGKLSTTNDVNSIVESTIADFASTGSVHSANDAYRAVTASDADTLNGKTAAQIASSAAPGDYSTVSNRAMSAIQEHQSLAPSTNYTDAVAAEFENGDRKVDYATHAYSAYIADNIMDSEGEAVSYGSLVTESTNAAVAVAAAKQDALPYPTNAIPYAAISGAPSGGGQEWRVVNYDVEVDAISFVTNGMAILTFINAGYAYGINVSTNDWPDGASMFVRGSFRAGATYTIPYDLRLIGYGTWPTNNFQSVWWRSGENI